MDYYVEDRLHWRPVGSDDLEELECLREQIESFDNTLLSAVDRDFSVEGVDGLNENCVGGWDNYGSLLAYGWNVVDPLPGTARVTLVGGVHPTDRFLSIGRRLIAWQEARALEWRDAHRPGTDLWMGCYVEAGQPGLQHNLAKAGFSVERHFIDMHRSLASIPQPRSVDGVEFVPFRLENSDEIHDLHHECFGADVNHDHWETSLARIRTDWSWVALADGVAIGYVFSGEDAADAPPGSATEGWTERLGVHPMHRHRGVASALLERTLKSMAGSGCASGGIGVDTTDPLMGTKMQSGLGYLQGDSVLLMSKVIAPEKSVS